jgi:dynein heavy chain
MLPRFRDYIPHEVKEALVRLGGMLPMNIFLRQEIDRMQKILTLVRRTLSDLKMALEGTIIMSDDLKEVLDNMYDARWEFLISGGCSGVLNRISNTK